MVKIIQNPKQVKLRKSKKCIGCGKELKKGDKAMYSSYAGNGTIYSIYECKICYDYIEKECFKCDDADYCIRENYTAGLIKECKQERGR